MRLRAPRRLTGSVTLAAALAVALTGCVASEREETSGEASGKDTFVFASSSDPAGLDPAFASDGETFRVARQIFEGLVGTVPGTADPAPLLAESWDAAEDGLSYTFHLKEGVTFHDGTEFDAEAVCFNFERWNNFTGVAATESMSYYWIHVNGGFASSEDEALDGTGKYESCTADDELTATVTLKSPLPELIPALSLPAFSMQSPTAIEEFDANNPGGTPDAPTLTEYAQGHPVGTGPYRFVSWANGERVELEANDEYWGEIADVKRIIFTVIDDPTARRQALEAGDVDGYDLVGPADVQALADAGYEIVNRDPFNVLYLGMNQAVPELADLRVRQAIAHAINKEALATSTLPEGTEVATQFVPPTVAGWSDEVTEYEYDPAKAEALLAEAGVADLTLTFNYPTNVSRPYMPSPEQIFEAVSADLEAVGITVEAVAAPWNPDYLDTIQGGADHGLHLLGWTGDYNDTYNFIGTFFGQASNEWGFDNADLFQAIGDARYMPTADEQQAAYETANEAVMEFLPGVPLAHPVPSLAFASYVEGYPASPVQDEVYNTITFTE